jgi:multidrug efflux pump
MIGVTVFGIFLTPVFYVMLRALSGNRPLTQHGAPTLAGEAAGHGAPAMPAPAAHKAEE